MPSKTHDLLVTMFREARDRSPAERPSIEAEREQSHAYDDAYRPVPGVTDEEFDGSAPGTRLMTPDGARDDLAIVHIHGGGFRAGSAKAVRALAAQVALGTGARVLLPEYRLAPEHPYPAALDDCEAAYERVQALFPEARVVVAGESAGANLAAALLMRRRDAGDTRALAGALFSGVFDLRPENYTSGSWVTNTETDLLLNPGLGPTMTADYLAGHSPEDGYVSPAIADLAGLPPLFIQVSSAELLLDDSLALAANAARSGVHVELEVWPHMQHVWQAATGFLPEATEAVERAVAFVRRVAEGRVVDGAVLSGGPASLEEVM
ncbi:acetyl esterase/lipase [Thermocatellispora tengchongensis]|uniref:Acetyl esterase/lipase n=1 Tax=Thermocatellispora tengchongensis TaxID=1073253 RepID=A0A840PCV8_9ACTN|nr:alpha/beta hydrolase [Thermocatellispora tengchongensis]MBB5136819.1 acetyl esterase/lipase [Thermocatellispora tengchongensis]